MIEYDDLGNPVRGDFVTNEIPGLSVPQADFGRGFTVIAYRRSDGTYTTEPPESEPVPCRLPHRCPVCEGRAVVPAGFYYPSPGPVHHVPEPCRTCEKGIVWG